MRILTLASLLLLLACSSQAPNQEGDLHRSIGSISAVIGDASFVAAHGRLPVATDDVDHRIQTHLLHVERLLRARSTAGFDDQRRAARERTLANLHDYALAMAFPIGESATGFMPTFIDDDDNRCAVAYLIEKSQGMDLARKINDEFRNAFVAEMESEDLVAWAEGTGLSLDELATVQPAYPPKRRDLRARFFASHDQQVGTSETDLEHQSKLEGEFRLKRGGSPGGFSVLGLDAGLGMAELSGIAYHLRALIGWDGGFSVYNSVINGERRNHWAAGPHSFGVRVGVGVDESGGSIGRALTTPLRTFYSFPTSENTRLALHAAPVFTLWGQDRSHGFRSALRLRWKQAFSWLGLDRWDVHLGLEYERKAGSDFAGLRFGLGKYRDDGWYITE